MRHSILGTGSLLGKGQLISSATSHSNFGLLLVCTGNICRSPAAERLFKSVVKPSVDPRSSGTYAMVGQPIAPPMASLLRDAGALTDDFAARQLSEQHIRDAHLVLAMTRDHRAAVVDLWPGAVRRTFTLREFARLVQLVDPEKLPAADAAVRLSAAIPLAAAERRQVSQSPEVDDIADPYRRSNEHYAEAFRQIQEAVNTIGNVIGVANPRASGDPATL